MSEKNNPLQDPAILIVVGIVVLSAIGKCAKDVPQTPPPFVPRIAPVWEATGTVLSTYVLPFLLVTATVFALFWIVCRYAKMGEVHSHDFRQIALCISVLSAIALFYPGLPNPYDKWRYGVWAAILFGAPLSFLFLASSHIQIEDERLTKKCTGPLHERINSQEREVSAAESETSNVGYQLQEARQEIVRLREHEKNRIEKERHESKRKGILDSEDF